MPYFFIMLLALVVRVYHYRHVLMSDEATNMLTIKALIEGDGLREYFYIHPPLFVLLSAGISYPIGDSHRLVQGVSIIFSVLSFIPLYLIVRRIFDERTAIVTLLSLAIMPLNVSYSTWVKPEGMILFFFLWSLYFYISEKPWKSGIFFGIASLTKEFAWFLMPIVAGWEFLKGWQGRESLKRLLGWMLTGSVLSLWWHAYSGGRSFKLIGEAATGGNLFEFAWHRPWYYYINNIPADLSWPLMPFFVVGLICLSRKCFIPHLHPNPPLEGEGNFLSLMERILGSKFISILWVLAFYLPLSYMTVKTPWYTYLASPALAIITSVGFLKVWDAVKAEWLKTLVGTLLILSIAVSISRFHAPFYYESHVAQKKERKLSIFYEKEYLTEGREILKKGGKIALLEYSPTLQYYLGIPDKRRLYVGPGFPAMGIKELRDFAELESVEWFVIDTNSINYLNRNIEDMTYLWGKPRKVGGLLIFKTDMWNF